MKSVAVTLLRLTLVLAMAVLWSQPVAAQCTDSDSDGFFYESGCGTARDCNDAAPTTHPGATELCDGYDNDCDRLTDENSACTTTCGSPEEIDDDTPVSTDLAMSIDPVLVWTGSEFGIAWGDARDGNSEIYFRRLDASGVSIGPEVRITDDPSDSSVPAITWSGREFAIVWTDNRDGNNEVYFTRIDATGVKIGDDIRVRNDEAGTTGQHAITWNGTEYGIAWVDTRNQYAEIYFVRMDANGVKLGNDARITTNSGVGALSVAWNGTEFLVAFEDSRIFQHEIFFNRIHASGVSLGADYRVTFDDERSNDPHVFWNGSQYAIVWRNSDDVYFARFSPSGATIGGTVRVTDSGQTGHPRLTWTGTEYGISWRDSRDGNDEIYFTRLDETGLKLGLDLRVTNDSAYSWGPSVVWTGASFGVTWRDGRDGHAEVYFSQVGCNCFDSDNDGFTSCNDCDDTLPDVYPGGTELCDGLNNDCDSPSWPQPVPTDSDDDLDSLSECAGDCDDTRPSVHPGAPQLCDGVNNDCDDPAWPTPPTSELDHDGDLVSECGGDCDDSAFSVYPAAPQLCDGINNDCNDNWPTVPATEIDDDSDTYAECQGDCNDTDDAVFPGATEICNSIDDDCDILIDEDELGEDTDGDTVHNLCDNCPTAFDPTQADIDSDAVGNVCDNCLTVPNPSQIDTDADTRGDACDNCPAAFNTNQDDGDSDQVGDVCDNCIFVANNDQLNEDQDTWGDACDNCPMVSNEGQEDEDLDQVGDSCDNCVAMSNPFQDDLDFDRAGDACDNCVADYNPAQSNFDLDFEGDHCDLDDGLIYITIADPALIEWQEEAGFMKWNAYKGDLDVLRATGVYTQVPGSSPLAAQDCKIRDTSMADVAPPPAGMVAFFLTTGVSGNTESDLGHSRPNDNPCP